VTYCWWKKSCITWDVWNPINNEINYLSTGAGFLPSTVAQFLQQPLVLLALMPLWEPFFWARNANNGTPKRTMGCQINLSMCCLIPLRKCLKWCRFTGTWYPKANQVLVDGNGEKLFFHVVIWSNLTETTRTRIFQVPGRSVRKTNGYTPRKLTWNIMEPDVKLWVGFWGSKYQTSPLVFGSLGYKTPIFFCSNFWFLRAKNRGVSSKESRESSTVSTPNLEGAHGPEPPTDRGGPGWKLVT